MKRAIMIFLVVMFLVAGNGYSYSQETSSPSKEYKFTVKTNPLAALGGPFWVVVIPVTGEYKAYFETKVTNKTSFQIGASYIGPSVLLNLDEITKSEDGEEIKGVKTSGYRIQGTYKFFVSRDLNAPEGFYLAPNISYATASVKNKANPDDKINGTKLNINGLIGYQLITSGGFTLDVFTGLGYVSRKYTVSGDFDSEEFKSKSSISVPFGLAFGYAF